MSPAVRVPVPGTPSRRSLLRAGGLLVGVTATASLSGCSIRLEDDAPAIPGLRRKSIPDEALLTATFHDVTSLSQMAGRVPAPGALVTQLNGIHRTQAGVIHGLLSAGGVPDHVIESAAPGSTPTPGSAVSAPPPATAAQLAAAEATVVAAAALAAVASSTTTNRPILTAIAAQRALAAGLLGVKVTWPAATPLPAAAAATLLDATRAVGYAFEIIAAQLAGDARTAALATLTAIRSREGELTTMAGPTASPDPLGYALPFAVTTPDLARKLSGVVLGQLLSRGLDPLASLPAASPALPTVVRLQVGAQSLARGWGVRMVPFPGMAYP